MTPELLVGLVITTMIGVLGHFLKSLINEARQTRDMTREMNSTLKGATDAIIALQHADREHSRQIIDIIERLVRMEERTQATLGPQPVRRVRAGK